MMSTYLRRIGFTVTTAMSAEKGWAELEADPGRFAVAVLDATLSGTSVEVLAVKMMEASPRLRVIVASGYVVDVTALIESAPGRVMFLHKPFTPEMLAKAVRRMVAAQEEAV
jgi:DNA-binding NtrC family response regulator